MRTGKSLRSCCSAKPPRSAVSSSDSLTMRTDFSRRLTAAIFRQEPGGLRPEGRGRARRASRLGPQPLPRGDPLQPPRLGVRLTPSPPLVPRTPAVGIRTAGRDRLAGAVQVGFLLIQEEDACRGGGPPFGVPIGDIWCEDNWPAAPWGPMGRGGVPGVRSRAAGCLPPPLPPRPPQSPQMQLQRPHPLPSGLQRRLVAGGPPLGLGAESAA